MADPTLAEAIERYRVDLDRLDAAPRRRLLSTYRSGYAGILDGLHALQEKIRTAPTIAIIRGDGTTTQGVPPSWIFQEQRYLDLQRQARGVVEEMGGVLADETMDARASAYRAGLADTRRMGSGLIPELSPSSWASVPRKAVEDFLGASGSGPLARLVSGFVTETGVEAEGLFRNVIGGGMMRGRSLMAVARELDAGFSSLTLSRSLTITRTETLRAYREASFRSMQANSKYVRSWIWRAAVDGARPPCAACFARHGTEYPIEAHGPDAPPPEPMRSHPNCRCVMVPQRADFLGLRPGGTSTRIEPLGRAAFDRLPPGRQRAILGPTRLGMYKRGEVAFSDFAGVRPGGAWGPNRAAITPIRDLRSMSSTTRTIRRAAEDRIARDLPAEPLISGKLASLEGGGANLSGYNYRVKTFESTARKVEKEIAESELPLTPEAAAGGLKDTLRYTYEIPESNYTASAIRIQDELLASGYQRVKWAPTWEGTGYKGLNSAFVEPTTGRVFELQFHTPLSLRVKETISHPLYEAQRKLTTGSREWMDLQRRIDEAWASVTIPPDVRRLYFDQ